MQRKRILGYARVSSAEQAVGTSLQDQQNVIRAYAKTSGLEVHRMHVEAESAIHEKIERREQILSLLREVRAGDVVVVDKIDRWSRDPEFSYRSIREILAKGANFYAVGDACDPSTPDGDTMLSFRILFAKEEHKRIKQRMVGTRRLLRARGIYAEGLPPFGYRRAGGRGPEKNRLLIEPKAAKLVRRAFALCLRGYSLTEIGDRLGITRDRVSNVLHARTLLGEVYDGREWMPNQHEAIIDARTFAEAQAALTKRKNGAGPSAPEDARTSTWWLRNIARCGLCGAKASASYGQTQGYYRCFANCTRRYINVEAVERLADPMVMARLLELRASLARPMPAAKGVDAEEIAGHRRALARKRERFLEAFADGDMNRDELRAALAKVDAARLKLDAQEQVTPAPTAKDLRMTLSRVEEISRAWGCATPRARRSIVEGLAESVGLVAGEPPKFVWLGADALIRREIRP